MPIYPSRNEPTRKIEVLEKREMELLKGIRINSSEEKMNDLAEKVREAQLNLIKAKLSLIRPYKSEDEERDQKLRQKLEYEARKWRRRSLRRIILDYKD